MFQLPCVHLVFWHFCVYKFVFLFCVQFCCVYNLVFVYISTVLTTNIDADFRPALKLIGLVFLSL
jgi:hypothetical protein